MHAYIPYTFFKTTFTLDFPFANIEIALNFSINYFCANCLYQPLPESPSRQRSFYTRQSGKEYSAKGSLPSIFFVHSANTLPSVEKHSIKKNTRQIKNHKPRPPKKEQKQFFKLWEQLSIHYHYPTHHTVIFLLFLNQIYMFCEWWNSNSQHFSRT
jgi:hypothetical protein